QVARRDPRIPQFTIRRLLLFFLEIAIVLMWIFRPATNILGGFLFVKGQWDVTGFFGASPSFRIPWYDYHHLSRWPLILAVWCALHGTFFLGITLFQFGARLWRSRIVRTKVT